LQKPSTEIKYYQKGFNRSPYTYFL
jgi:hypothetical protein